MDTIYGKKVRRETREMPLLSREAPIVKVDQERRTFELVWTTGAQVRRYDWGRERFFLEELSLDPGHVRMGRLQSGRASLLDSHAAGSVSAVLGVVVGASLDGREGRATVRFSRRDEVQAILQDVRDGIISSVSCGYNVYRYQLVAPKAADGLWVYRAVDWEPMELSLVPIPADIAAAVQRSGPGQRQAGAVHDCEFILPPEPKTAAEERAAVMQAKAQIEREGKYGPLEQELVEVSLRYVAQLEQAEQQAAATRH